MSGSVTARLRATTATAPDCFARSGGSRGSGRRELARAPEPAPTNPGVTESVGKAKIVHPMKHRGLFWTGLTCLVAGVWLHVSAQPSPGGSNGPANPGTNAVPGTAPRPGAATNEVAVIQTSEGTMVLEFWPDVAPGHVENFKKLARQGFYDGTCFHRVIKGFMIQGGDPLTRDESQKARWGTGGPGYTIKAEFNSRKHVRGVLSMARTSDPNSAGSQFFICHADAPHLDGQYTAFGRLIRGEEVLDRIANTPTDARNRPLKRVHVESIRIVPADQAP